VRRALRFFRIVARQKTTFRDLAFDASTSASIYNIAGVILKKNCVCALTYVAEPVGDDEED
jgi:hypothetical protein